jgi:hypothetical protein
VAIPKNGLGTKIKENTQEEDQGKFENKSEIMSYMRKEEHDRTVRRMDFRKTSVQSCGHHLPWR